MIEVIAMVLELCYRIAAVIDVIAVMAMVMEMMDIVIGLKL